MRAWATTTGFSLIELMIVIAIIGVLVSISLPSYQNYTRRAHYAEIVQAAAPYKLGVEECYLTTGELEPCHSGQAGIPNAFENHSELGLVNSVNVQAGAIIITPKQSLGFSAEDTYILTPTISHNSLHWQAGGGGVSRGFAH
jgi:type IV pilus assembly protein PilA